MASSWSSTRIDSWHLIEEIDSEVEAKVSEDIGEIGAKIMVTIYWMQSCVLRRKARLKKVRLTNFVEVQSRLYVIYLYNG